MASGRNNFFGIGIIPSTSTTNTTPGDVEYLTTDGKLHIRGVSANDAVVQEALAATLTNKTLTAPVIATIVNTGTLTLPSSTDTLVGRATTDTLTNKSISGATNTLTAIPNTALTNSSVTINGSSVSLGGSVTVTATATAALTLGTGLTGTSYNGATAVTAAIDPSVVATLTGAQTLSNKTLTSPVLNTAFADTITSLASANLYLNAVSGQSVQTEINGTTVQTVSATGVALASGAVLSLKNNSQTVSLAANSAASASYTVTLPAAAPTTGTALVYNGTSYVWTSVVSSGFVTSTQSVGAAGQITLSTSIPFQAFLVSSSVAGGTSANITPFSTAPADGTSITLTGTSDANPVTITNNDATGGCLLAGNCTLYRGTTLNLIYYASLSRYVETDRNSI